ncbi:MAG: iron ABC transporter permease [Firmicutes bacterium]|nr:iron ABC transporter permease [Bacillota bacterium]
MKKRVSTVYITMVLVLIGLSFVSLRIGSVSTTTDPIVYQNIVTNIRLPRILAALFLGGALSVSGYLLQTFFQNPIAGPYVLGISSGAKLFVALTMIIALEMGITLSSVMMIASAFVGSMLAMGFVLIFAGRVRNMSYLVVCGILIGYICSAITDFCITFAQDSNIVNLHNWSLGSLSGMDWQDIQIIVFFVTVCVLLVFFLSKPISAYQLGEGYAQNMGVSIKRLRVVLILLSSLLSSIVTAFAGPISFVGIAVPHLVKGVLRTSKPIVLIPATFLMGAIVTLFCDGIARSVFAPVEMSISSVTAIILVPVVITILLKKQERRV